MASTSSRPPLPNASDIVGFPIDADMQWIPKKGELSIRVFYRYRGKEVPKAIAAEMQRKLEQFEKEGRTGSPEVRRYIGEVHNNVFYPNTAFKAQPHLYPRPIKSLKGRRARKLDEAVMGVFSAQHERLTNPEGTYSLGVGATGVLAGVAADSHITEDLYGALCDVFPKEKAAQLYPKVLSVAFFQAHTGEANWHIEHWSARRAVPAKLYPSQVTALFAELGPKEAELRAALAKRRFARHKGNKGDLYALDGTNSPCNAKKVGLAFVGKGKEGTLQRQLVISYLYSAETGLPLTYNVYPGNMADVSSLSIYKNLWESYGIKDSEAISVFDRGYFKTSAMLDFNRTGIPYLCAVKTNLKFVEEAILSVGNLVRRENQIEGTAVFGKVMQVYMVPNCEESKVYLHLYFSPEVLAKEMREFDNKLQQARHDWDNGKELSGEVKDLFKKPVKGCPLEEDLEAVNKAYAALGFFGFVSNTISNCAMCLARYGLRNGVEVCFKTAKTTTGLSTLRAHNDATMMGKIFVNFIAVMTASAVMQRMRRWHIPKENSEDGYDMKMPLCRRTAYRKLLHEVDAVFLHKEPKCEPMIQHETEKINRIIRQLRLPKNFFDSAQKIIELITRVPDLPTDSAPKEASPNGTGG